VVKQGLFYALSFVIANVFLAYIIGSDALWAIITDPPSQHFVGLSIIVIFSFVFYLVFARFREQARAGVPVRARHVVAHRPAHSHGDL
jgi:hypothetical protein